MGILNFFSRFRQPVELADDSEATDAKTGAQQPTPPKTGIGVVGHNQKEAKPSLRCIKTWREMRNHPTIALARATAGAPIRKANYAINEDNHFPAPDGAKELLGRQVKHLWRKWLYNQIYSLDYGYQAYETVWGMRDGQHWIEQLKYLTPEHTRALIERSTGAYAGLLNGAAVSTSNLIAPREGIVELEPMESFWYANEQEGANYYGESVMKRAQAAWDGWNVTNRKANTYYTKNANPIPMIEYPEGQSRTADGSTVENFSIANQLINGLARCEGVAMPNIIAAYAQDLINAGADPQKLAAWKLSFIETSSQHGTEFLERLTSYEVQMARAWFVPERTIFEGQHGTKAEADSHGNILLSITDLITDDMTVAFNEQVVEPWLRLNYGPEYEKSLMVVVEDLDPKVQEFLRKLTAAQLGAPINADLFEDLVDLPNVLDLLGIPTRAEDDEVAEDKPVEITTEDDEVVEQVEDALDVVPSQALNGAQVKEAKAIMVDVIAGTISKETAIDMLVTFFNMPKDVAARLIAKIKVDPKKAEQINEQLSAELAAYDPEMDKFYRRKHVDDVWQEVAEIQAELEE